jgi:hypothetical protein
MNPVTEFHERIASLLLEGENHPVKAIRQLDPSVLAILARFHGDHVAAMKYCTSIAQAYPNRAKEYEAYGYTILEMKGSRI